MEVVVTAEAISCTKLQLDRQYQQNNTQLFTALLSPNLILCCFLWTNKWLIDWLINQQCQSMGLFLSLCFNSHFPREPGLAGVYWIKGWFRWWWQLDYWSYKSCKAAVKSSPPTSRFLQDGCPSCRPTNSVKALKGKISHSMDLFTLSSSGVFQLFRLDALALSVIATATWLAGWLGGCLSQPVLYQND